MIKNILTVITLGLLVQLAGCKEDSVDVSPLEKNKTMLTSITWGSPDVEHGTDGNLSGDYTDFVITFTPNSTNGYEGLFIASNGSHAFTEASGFWKFNADLTKIIFDSGKEMEFQLTEDHLRLDFTVSDPGGRVNGLSGHFTFDLQPL